MTRARGLFCEDDGTFIFLSAGRDECRQRGRCCISDSLMADQIVSFAQAQIAAAPPDQAHD
jgi:hypothetical protein